MLKVRIDGADHEQALSVQATRSMRSLCGNFTVESSADVNLNLPLSVGQRVEIVTDSGKVFLTGFVDRIEVIHDAQNHAIRASGRAVTCDLLDSSLPKKRFIGPVAYPDLVSQVVSSLGLPGQVINRAGQIENISEIEQVSGDVGVSAYRFLESYGRRAGVILTTDPAGNFLIIRGQGVQTGTQLVSRQRGADNNILSSRLEVDHTDRFNTYTARSQMTGFASDLQPRDLVSSTGSATDARVRGTRFLEFNTEESSTSEVCTQRCEIEANVRRANSFQYEAVVQGNENEAGELWDFNSLVQVQDDFANISDELLIHTVSTSFSLSRGSITTLLMSLKDAFTFEAEQNSQAAARSQSEERWIDLL